MQISCPHCNTALDVAPEHFGQQVQCPACSNRFQIPDGPTEPSDPDFQKPERQGWEERDHANVNFGKSFIIGASITAGWLLLMVPFQSSRFGAIFLERGWVNYTETLLFFWGLTILFMKLNKNKHQAQAALLNLFPESIGKEINSSTVGAFIDNIYSTPLSLRDSLIVNRIRKALELFESRCDNGEVSSFLSTQSDLDANRSAGSYALIKVFLWAIPILGFIGTVMGLSVAVGSLAMGDNTDPDALKESINNLTGGLGVAFDTTLLGLILSILLSFPLSAVQKREDETLTLIDTFCTEKLLPKLNDSKQLGTDELIEQAESIPQLVASLARAHETFLINLNKSTVQLNETHTKLEGSLDKAVTKLSDTSSELFLKSHNNLTRSFESIASGIESINRSLRLLGEKQIPGAIPKKRGFFSRN
ncbi:MAG: MotA/TolQ/ExbB proton channel family protein [Akkermansiaceae bacterium]